MLPVKKKAIDYLKEGNAKNAMEELLNFMELHDFARRADYKELYSQAVLVSGNVKLFNKRLNANLINPNNESYEQSRINKSVMDIVTQLPDSIAPYKPEEPANIVAAESENNQEPVHKNKVKQQQEQKNETHKTDEEETLNKPPAAIITEPILNKLKQSQHDISAADNQQGDLSAIKNVADSNDAEHTSSTKENKLAATTTSIWFYVAMVALVISLAISIYDKSMWYFLVTFLVVFIIGGIMDERKIKKKGK